LLALFGDEKLVVQGVLGSFGADSLVSVRMLERGVALTVAEASSSSSVLRLGFDFLFLFIAASMVPIDFSTKPGR
jgi:hypothetical protein